MKKVIIIVAAIGVVVGAGFAVSAYVQKERKEASFAAGKRLYDRNFKAHMEAWSEKYDADIATHRQIREIAYRIKNNIGDEIINLKAYLEATLEDPHGNKWYWDTYIHNVKGFDEAIAEVRYHEENLGYELGFYMSPLEYWQQ